jgi:hypothetical protein
LTASPEITGLSLTIEGHQMNATERAAKYRASGDPTLAAAIERQDAAETAQSGEGVGDVTLVIVLVVAQLLKWVMAVLLFTATDLLKIPGIQGYSKSNILGTILGKGINGANGLRLERRKLRDSRVFLPCQENTQLLWRQLVDRKGEGADED